MEGYNFTAADFPLLLVRTFYPERTDRETPVIRDWLLAHLVEYDRISFSVRVGQGNVPDTELLPGVARSAERSSKKRIDILAWQGALPTIVEVKERVTAAVIGQLRMYRLLLLEELPDAPEPKLIAIGRYSDPDTIRALNSEGITVLLYPGEDGG